MHLCRSIGSLRVSTHRELRSVGEQVAGHGFHGDTLLHLDGCFRVEHLIADDACRWVVA